MADEKTTPAEPENEPAWEGSLTLDEENVAADGHIVGSKEDIKARKAAEKKA